MPPDVRARLSPECADFVLSLLTDADRRLGRGGAGEVMQHEWFRGVDWQTVHQQPAPYAPRLADSLAESLEALRWAKPGSQQCAALVRAVTTNFDCSSTIGSNGMLLSGCVESNIPDSKEMDLFSGYSFKREKVCPVYYPIVYIILSYRCSFTVLSCFFSFQDLVLATLSTAIDDLVESSAGLTIALPSNNNEES